MLHHYIIEWNIFMYDQYSPPILHCTLTCWSNITISWCRVCLCLAAAVVVVVVVLVVVTLTRRRSRPPPEPWCQEIRIQPDQDCLLVR